MESMIVRTDNGSADSDLRPAGDYFAEHCYACPGCERDPFVSIVDTDVVISCGHSGCGLPFLLHVSAPTAAEAVRAWNRKSLDTGDLVADQQRVEVDLPTESYRPGEVYFTMRPQALEFESLCWSCRRPIGGAEELSVAVRAGKLRSFCCECHPAGRVCA